jgi:anti-sigma factor RsiW
VNCSETLNLLPGYVDGELDLVRNLEIEQHLQDCPACGPVFENQRQIRAALGDSELRFKAPATLRQRIDAQLREASPAPILRRWRPVRWLAVAAAILLAVFGGWSLLQVASRSVGSELVVKELVASHIRSQLLPGHLADVESSNRHKVKPWFDGKVNFAPTVSDFTDQGYHLTGGRLDYLDDKPVAVLVYKRREHVINLFIWKTTRAGDGYLESRTQQGFHLVHWVHGGLSYWAISDLNVAELEDFARLVQSVN